MVAAPPVAQCPAGEQGDRPCQGGVVGEGRSVIAAVAKKVQVHGSFGAGFEPAIVVKHKAGRIVYEHPARTGEQALFEGDTAAGVVQGAVSSQQVLFIRLAVLPRKIVAGDGQVVGREAVIPCLRPIFQP